MAASVSVVLGLLLKISTSNCYVIIKKFGGRGILTPKKPIAAAFWRRSREETTYSDDHGHEIRKVRYASEIRKTGFAVDISL